MLHYRNLRKLLLPLLERRRRQAVRQRAEPNLGFERLERRLLLAAPNPLDLSTLNGTTGFTFVGVAGSDASGFSVSSAGDVNGDGFDDLLISAPNADPGTPARNFAGEVYLVFGGDANLAALDALDTTSDGRIELANLNGTNGFTLEGIDPGDNLGNSVSSVGDVNGDGFDDLLIGAPLARPGSPVRNNAGESYLVFGGTTNLTTLDAADTSSDGRIELSNLNGTTGFILEGVDTYDGSGISVSNAGDVNGDGFHDLLIGTSSGNPGSPARNNAGSTYLVFGGATTLGTLDAADASADGRIELSRLDGTTGFVLGGITPGDTTGRSVSAGGDVNGDGFGDLLVSSPFVDPGTPARYDAGESYVIFGGATNLAVLDAADTSSDGQINLTHLDGTSGFNFEGIFGGDGAGYSISTAGDVNGDGFDDLLIGATGADPGAPPRLFAGEAYLVFGGAQLAALDTADTSSDGRINLSNLNGTTGFVLEGIAAADNAGKSVSSAGDVNGDGFDDLLIGADSADPGSPARNDAGESYVLFGGAANLAMLDAADASSDGRINLASPSGTTGFILEGAGSSDASGTSVSSAGDVNGDGFDDLLIGADFAFSGVNGFTGETYLVFGGNFTPDAGTQVGGAGTQTLSATQGAAVDRLIGGAGDDTLVSDGGDDILIGGEGDDTLAIPDATFASRRLQGGLGTDTLRLDGSGMHLDLTSIADNRIEEIEVIDITGSGDNMLTVDLQEVLNLSDHSNTLLVRRDSGDTVNIGGGWSQQANETIGPDDFEVFTQGAATIKVQAPPAVSLTLGDQVWIDRNFNGTFDPGIDLAPNGVTVNLYQDDGDGMLDAGDGAPIATTVTMNIGGQDGRYEFAGLAAGEYIVEVVTSSGPLTGATSIVGATDPDNDVDGDDNGAPVFGFEVASAAITLSAGGETLGNEDGDGDPDTNRTLDFGFDQPITINGNTASVLGTSGDDLIRYDLSAGRVTVNSSTFQLPGNVTNVQFDGGPGNDQFILVGTSGAEGVRLLPGVAFLDSSSVGVTGTAVSMETILYRGGGGADRPIFIDSTGNDTFISRPMRATMQGPGYLNIAEDVVLVQAVASRGGADQARLFDTLGDDTFTAQPGAASMLGNGLDVRTYSFEHVVGMASTGHDRARLFGGPGADTLIGRPAVSVLASATQLSEANFFDVVTVRGGSAGDTARLFGDSGREVLAAAQDSVVFSSSISNIFTAAFTRHIADGGGGNDLARLFGSSFDDTFSASSAASQLTSSGGHDLQVVNFAQVVSHALGGTGDLAILTDSIGDDSFLADGTRGDMIGSGYLIQVNGFDTVRIRGVSGGINRRVVNNIAFMLIEQGTWI